MIWKGLLFVPIDDQVRMNQKETMPFVGQFLPPVTDTGSLCKLAHRVFESVKNTVGSFNAVLGDVIPKYR
jgi:hypothetical protein